MAFVRGLSARGFWPHTILHPFLQFLVQNRAWYLPSPLRTSSTPTPPSPLLSSHLRLHLNFHLHLYMHPCHHLYLHFRLHVVLHPPFHITPTYTSRFLISAYPTRLFLQIEDFSDVHSFTLSQSINSTLSRVFLSSACK